jgi:lipopolysaccharide transport system ATP-binding protein
MSSSDSVIRARNLGKAYQLYDNRSQWSKQVLLGAFHTYYRSFWALKDVTFEVKRGESIALIGRNGCGKSTLLQVICGILRPTKGELWVKGRIAPVLALGSTFDLESTGRENVMIGGAVLGMKRPEVLSKFDSIVDFAGVGEFIDQPIKHYSTGMRSRLSFALCAHLEADILIVDEALAVGDAAFQRKCMDWIERFRDHGTLLFVSHAKADVMRLCRRAIWIDDGRIREDGKPVDVVRSYARAMETEPDDMKRFTAV